MGSSLGSQKLRRVTLSKHTSFRGYAIFVSPDITRQREGRDFHDTLYNPIYN